MSGIRPSRRGKMRALLSSETSDRTESGDDVDFDGGGVFTDTSALDSWKQPVRVASTASVTISTALNSGDTIDGVTLATDDRVLLKDQSTASQNGIYVVGATPDRAADMDDDDEVVGSLVYVVAGTANTGKVYKNTNLTTPTVGSTSLTFTEFGAGSSSFATPSITLASTAAAGAASTVIRSDSTIAAFDATVPVTQAFSDTAATGSAAFAARRDHKHGMPASPGGGGSTVDWALNVNETGTSFANFTAHTGTWSSNGTEIIQTDTSATQRRAKYNTLVPIGFPLIIECEVQVVSIGSGGFYRVGINLSDNANGQGLIAYIDRGAGSVNTDLDSTSGINSASTTINLTTWYKLRLVVNGYLHSLYLDGTLKFNGVSPALRVNAQYVGLTSYAASVKWRNFKVWTLSTGAPA